MKAYFSKRDWKFGRAVIITTDDKLVGVELLSNEHNTMDERRHSFLEKTFEIDYQHFGEHANKELLDKIINCLNNGTIDKSIEFHVIGTPFQKAVWSALCQVPTGTTVTYKQIAEVIGNPKAARAVGTACKNNPIAYFIPCHRILPSNGETGQYRWGRGIKQQLLDREKANIAQRQEATV